MGFSSSDARVMSLWQFLAAWEGYVQANSTDEDKKLSVKEADELWNWIEGM